MAATPNLMQTFDFSPADLAANQQGRLGERQAHSSRWIEAIRHVLGVMALTIGLGLLMSFTTGQGSTIFVIVLALLTLLALAGAGYVLWYARKQPTVRQVQGRAHLEDLSALDNGVFGKLGGRYMLTIGGERFLLENESQYHALSEGAVYIVYFIEGGGQITAIETTEAQ